MVKVLHVVESMAASMGGTTTCVANVSSSLTELGVSNSVAFAVSNKLEASDFSNIQKATHAKEIFPFVRMTRVYSVSWRFAFWIFRSCKDFDIVHIHGVFNFFSTLTALCCFIRRVPYVVAPHGMVNKYGRSRFFLKKWISIIFFEFFIFYFSKFVHLTSEAEASEFIFPAKSKIIALPCKGFEGADNYVSFSEKPNFSGSSHKFNVLFLSRLHPVKNLDLVIRAASHLREFDFVINVAGDGAAQYVNSLKQLCTDLGVAKKVCFMGHVSGQQKAELLASSDLFVQLSSSEAFGYSLIESAFMGVPVLTTRSSGIAQDLEARGLAVCVGTSQEEVCTALRRIFSGDLKLRVSADQVRNVRRDYGYAAVGGRLLQAYSS